MDALTQVITEPASLAVRQALAAAWEAAGDPRAELVRAQLEIWELARAGRATAREQELRRTAQRLITAHGQAWAGPVAGLVDKVGFHRGLVAEVRTSVDQLVANAPALFAAAPIQHLDLTGPITRWAELCALPQLAQIVSLQVARVPALGDREAALLAKCRHATGLRWLSLMGCGVGRPGAEALAASPYLEQVVFLSLRDNPCDPTPRIYQDELSATIEPTPLGQELIRTYGPRPWLTGPAPDDALVWPPDRDRFAAR